MSAIRLARTALRARSAAIARPVQRRGYADAVSDKIKLSLALPHNVGSRSDIANALADSYIVYLQITGCVRIKSDARCGIKN